MSLAEREQVLQDYREYLLQFEQLIPLSFA
jgi:hypothetical protein